MTGPAGSSGLAGGDGPHSRVGTEARSVPPGGNPWSRYGWIIQSVWLVFLVFPIVTVVGSGLPAWQVAIGLLAIVAFGAVYSLGVHHLDLLEKARRPMYGAGALWLLAMVALALLTVPLIGYSASSFLPFVVAFAMFGLPIAWGVAITVMAFLVSLVAAIYFEVDEGGWVIAAIVLSIGVMLLGVRIMSDRSARYDELQRELGLVEERERVARDVHDVLGHSLTVVTVKAELAERLVELDPDRARAELADIQALSRQALAEIRETVGGLRAARLTVELSAARMALTGAGIRADVADDVDEVDPRHRTVLAWVLREAVTNVVRHSGATTCRVDLGPNLLRVIDDGRGVDGSRPGNGLRGVRERVESSGGRLSVGPGENGHGTVLEVVL
ncbi:sensor histidine kinase [Intrasporangium sp.]|uniref:sensor histidine kinase n=1 Tax=Intrasporangium sp. TaxID=1925024 RepID=UPI003221C4A5